MAFAGGSGLSILDELPFEFRGVRYRTAQNAFQAQKAPPPEREKFANVPANEATRLGRACTIDVPEWDANRGALMTEIITAQAMQHDGMRRTLVDLRGQTITGLGSDPFWGIELPKIWAAVGESLAEQEPEPEPELQVRPRPPLLLLAAPVHAQLRLCNVVP